MCEACVIQYGLFLSLLLVSLEILLIVSGAVRFAIEILVVLLSIYVGYCISKKPLRREDIAYDTVWRRKGAKVNHDKEGPFIYMYSGFMIYSSYIIRAKVILVDLNITNPFDAIHFNAGSFSGDGSFGMFVKNLDTAKKHKAIVEIAQIGWLDTFWMLIRIIRGIGVTHDYFDKNHDYQVVYRT